MSQYPGYQYPGSQYPGSVPGSQHSASSAGWPASSYDPALAGGQPAQYPSADPFQTSEAIYPGAANQPTTSKSLTAPTVLAAAGLAVLLLAIIGGIGSSVTRGQFDATITSLPDDQAATVELDKGSTYGLFYSDGDDAPDCSVTSPNGDDVTTKSSSSSTKVKGSKLFTTFSSKESGAYTVDCSSASGVSVGCRRYGLALQAGRSERHARPDHRSRIIRRDDRRRARSPERLHPGRLADGPAGSGGPVRAAAPVPAACAGRSISPLRALGSRGRSAPVPADGSDLPVRLGRAATGSAAAGAGAALGVHSARAAGPVQPARWLAGAVANPLDTARVPLPTQPRQGHPCVSQTPGSEGRCGLRGGSQRVGVNSTPAARMSSRAARPSSGLTGSVRSVRTRTR